jgi:hypothetical protein
MLAWFISYLTFYQLSFPNAFIGNLFESALTARFPLKTFAGMTSVMLGMNQHNLRHALIFYVSTYTARKNFDSASLFSFSEQ